MDLPTPGLHELPQGQARGMSPLEPKSPVSGRVRAWTLAVGGKVRPDLLSRLWTLGLSYTISTGTGS